MKSATTKAAASFRSAVDHIYLQSSMEFLKLVAAFVRFTTLSDHVPVVVDITIDKSKMPSD